MDFSSYRARIEASSTLRPGRERGVPFNDTECRCFRPRRTVLCVNCGFQTHGRVRYSCPNHPHSMFLMDLTQCPDCKAYESLLCEIDRTAKAETKQQFSHA